RARPRVTEELVDRVEAGTRQDALHAHVWVLPGQVAVQLDLRVVGRGEVGVPALGGKRPALAPGPDETGRSQSGAGGDDGGVASGLGLAGLEGDEVGRG